jgi:hypothetical protein
MGEQRVFGGEIFQRQIGGVAVIAVQHDRASVLAWLASFEQLPRRQARPLVVVARPRGHAMDVGDDVCLRLRKKLRKIPEDRIVDRTIDVEPPAFARYLRRQSEIERRPVPRQMLPGRQPRLFGTRGRAGEETALLRPALLAARQLGVRRFVTPAHRHWWRCIADSCLVSRMVE